MKEKVNAKSLIIAVLLGIIIFFVLGATHSSNKSVYQLSMAANDEYVVYGRIHTGTGRIETWKCGLEDSVTVPESGGGIFRKPAID